MLVLWKRTRRNARLMGRAGALPGTPPVPSGLPVFRRRVKRVTDPPKHVNPTEP